ncbi:hypothetical protein ML462_15535 [Gramella lutea]|uniref:Lipoprotein n=1 Tax=Christiangramia lutea TaxID=1607951 RepID=A0A9X1V672_9FLAO|nr:hypothetical protein [Christiangramia lutea]MCH4824585.1 hypothetical protein [Christiangramia lutea]
MRKIYILILIVTLQSCKSRIEKIQNSNTLKDCIINITSHINNCYEGSNQIEVDEKAQYNYESNVLTIYIGESVENYFQKWEIPLAKLDKNRIELNKEDFFIPSIKVNTKDNTQEITYYENGEFESNSNQHSYYLMDYCLEKKDEKEYFLESLKRAVALVQK